MTTKAVILNDEEETLAFSLIPTRYDRQGSGAEALKLALDSIRKSNDYIKYIVTDEEKKALTNKAKSKIGMRKGPITEIEKKVAKKLYRGEVNFFDDQFGQLVGYLEESGLLENTIVILTADHGESFWEKGVRGHGGSLYEEEIKIPLIIYLPGQKSGKIITNKVRQIDILPTIC